MKYMTREEMIEAAKSLGYCLERGQDEDAQQWALEILNGLYGAAVGKFVAIRDAVEQAARAARPGGGA